MIGFRAAVAATALVMTVGAAAAQDDDIANKIINNPAPGSYSVYGLQTPPKPRKDDTVQGGKALRVSIPSKGANPYDIGLSDPIPKPVAAGHKLVVAFWARAEQGADGGTTAKIGNVSIQLSTAPYTGFMGAPFEVGPEWKMYNLEGTTDRDYKAGELTVSMHLATAKQVVDIGPIFVLDMGPAK